MDSLSAKKAHRHNEQYFIKGREGRNYSNTLVKDDSIYIVEREYRHNKSVPNLKRMVVIVQNVKTKQYETYMGVIYFLENDEDVKQIEIIKQGNSKSTYQSYIRTSKAVLERQHNLLASGRRSDEVYDILIEESGGSCASVSISIQPRNMKQICNRKSIINVEEKENRSINTGVDELTNFLQSQRN